MYHQEITPGVFTHQRFRFRFTGGVDRPASARRTGTVATPGAPTTRRPDRAHVVHTAWRTSALGRSPGLERHACLSGKAHWSSRAQWWGSRVPFASQAFGTLESGIPDPGSRVPSPGSRVVGSAHASRPEAQTGCPCRVRVRRCAAARRGSGSSLSRPPDDSTVDGCWDARHESSRGDWPHPVAAVHQSR